MAGNGINSTSGDGGQATSASIAVPRGVTTDAAGNLYIAELINHRVRKVTPDGRITTVAGGLYGFSGDGGPATSASLAHPVGVAVDSQGNLYIAEFHNHRIRKVDSRGIISTIAGSGPGPADFGSFSGDGGPATAAILNVPTSVAVDRAGNIYVADSFNNRIRRINAAGIITTFAGNGVNGFSGDGGPATSASISGPTSVAVDTSGNLYVAEYNRIRKITTAGIITTLAGDGQVRFFGDGGQAASASLNPGEGGAHQVAVDDSGNVYVADSGNRRVRKVNTSGIITTIAGVGPLASGDGDPPRVRPWPVRRGWPLTARAICT